MTGWIGYTVGHNRQWDHATQTWFDSHNATPPPSGVLGVRAWETPQMGTSVPPGVGSAVWVAVPAGGGGGAANRPPDPSRDAQLARVSRRDMGTAVKATGIIKPMVGAEVKVG